MLVTRWLFFRFLSLIYLIAFASLWPQVKGLAGSHGILPVQNLLQSASTQLGNNCFLSFPTLAWFNSGDYFLQVIVESGVVFSLLALSGLAVLPSLVILWLLYLSLVTSLSEFMSFQWDMLLLEVGFLAILFAPKHILSVPWKSSICESPPSFIVLWLFRFLLFRLMFSSGAVKLLSGDTTWWNLTALTHHYETQPLPTPVSWYAAQLPLLFQKLSVLIVLVIELVVPFFIFAPKKLRLVAAMLLVLLQVLITITGNYAFFNFLTISLCLLLLDDDVVSKLVPQSLVRRFSMIGQEQQRFNIRDWPLFALAVVLLGVGLSNLIGLFNPVYVPYRLFDSYAGQLRIVNSYGLFAVMTTSRPEIIIEGSNDGVRWSEYEFKYKPGDLKRAPPWVAPHQPRLDWQMWFAALGTYRTTPWFLNFALRLLEGSPDVLILLEKNPFPDEPPQYIRALLYEYRFADPRSRKASGNWWTRTLKGIYLPPTTRTDSDSPFYI